MTTVQAITADIVGGGHAIIVHESAENIQNYIACGDIGGSSCSAADLPIGLAPLNDSGYSGVALLHDNGDGTTTVSVFLTKSGDGGEVTDMGNTTAAGGAAEGEVAANIKDFAFDPGTIEVAVGTTVTWTNNDTVPHTVSQSGGGFESGKPGPGHDLQLHLRHAGHLRVLLPVPPEHEGHGCRDLTIPSIRVEGTERRDSAVPAFGCAPRPIKRSTFIERHLEWNRARGGSTNAPALDALPGRCFVPYNVTRGEGDAGPLLDPPRILGSACGLARNGHAPLPLASGAGTLGRSGDRGRLRPPQPPVISTEVEKSLSAPGIRRPLPSVLRPQPIAATGFRRAGSGSAQSLRAGSWL